MDDLSISVYGCLLDLVVDSSLLKILSSGKHSGGDSPSPIPEMSRLKRLTCLWNQKIIVSDKLAVVDGDDKCLLTALHPSIEISSLNCSFICVRISASSMLSGDRLDKIHGYFFCI